MSNPDIAEMSRCHAEIFPGCTAASLILFFGKVMGEIIGSLSNELIPIIWKGMWLEQPVKKYYVSLESTEQKNKDKASESNERKT